MNRKLLGCVFALSLAVPSIALACDADKKEQAAATTVKSLTIPELTSLQKEKKATVLDANFEQFRKQNGVIPGAVMLTSFNKYDVAKELPAAKDSKLVFYCANTQCMASHAAAQRALEAGYTDVNVLPDGLLGWKKAGQPTATVTPQS
jgi:rhodanese-related sulfurtransferase